MRSPDRRTLLVVTVATSLVAVAVMTYVRLRPRDAEPPVPTVPVINTQTNIGCIDETGTVEGLPDEWYSDGAGGSLVLTGELSASNGLGAFSAVATKVLVAQVGRFTTSEVRDLAPTPTACVTMRYAGYELDGGATIEVTAWRVVSATSPMWVPNEAAFVLFDDTTLASAGEHVVNTLTVAPDGTTVLVAATGPADTGAAPADAEQLAAIGAAVLEHVVAR